MSNKNYRRLKSQNRLSGRFETGGIFDFRVDSPASPLGTSGDNFFYKVSSSTSVNWKVSNGRGYVSKHSESVIGNSTRVNSRTNSIEYFISAGGGSGAHGGGGAGGFAGNGPLTPAPQRNTDLTAPQFSFIQTNNTITPISKNATGGFVGFVSSYSQTLSIGAGGGAGANGGDTTFFGRTATGGGKGGSSGQNGQPGACGGGAGRNASPGPGSQGGSGGATSNTTPAGQTGGGGGGMNAGGSGGTGGSGFTITLPTPEAIGGGGAGGGGSPGPAYCTGPVRPDGYCFGTFVPGAGAPAGSPGGFGGGAAGAGATSNGAGGGGTPNNGSSTTSGSNGAGWFISKTNITKLG
jgi:hypothetical protein